MTSLINITPTPDGYRRIKATFKHSIETRKMLIQQSNDFIDSWIAEANTSDYDEELLNYLEGAAQAFIAEQNRSIYEMEAAVKKLEEAGY